MDPNFEQLGYSWVDGDPRSAHLKEVDPERRERLARRLAEALSRRREEIGPQPSDAGSLIVSVSEERFTEKGLDGGAMDQLEKWVQEHAEKFADE